MSDQNEATNKIDLLPSNEYVSYLLPEGGVTSSVDNVKPISDSGQAEIDFKFRFKQGSPLSNFSFEQGNIGFHSGSLRFLAVPSKDELNDFFVSMGSKFLEFLNGRYSQKFVIAAKLDASQIEIIRDIWLDHLRKAVPETSPIVIDTSKYVFMLPNGPNQVWEKAINRVPTLNWIILNNPRNVQGSRDTINPKSFAMVAMPMEQARALFPPNFMMFSGKSDDMPEGIYNNESTYLIPLPAPWTK